MDTLFLHRAIGAVRTSLIRAGERDFVLWRADDADDWFWYSWLFDYLDRIGHRVLPIYWGNGLLPAFDTWTMERHDATDKIRRLERHGSIFLSHDAAIALIACIAETGEAQSMLIVGERRAGALGSLVDGYGAYVHERAPAQPKIHVVGGDDIPRPRNLTWDDVTLPADLRRELRLQVDSFFAARDTYKRMGVPYRRGLLLTGQPGNGKTTVLRIIASTREEPVVLMCKRPERDRNLLDQAFDRATFQSPSVLCLEDIDTLFGEEIPLSYFLNRLDGLAPMEGVLVIATTNHPEKLDQALTNRPSRFDRVYVLGNPGPEERHAYLRSKLGEAFDERFVRCTDGFSMAQLKEIWVSACLEAIHHGLEGPTLDAARRAVERLSGQRLSLERDWESTKPIGFRGV